MLLLHVVIAFMGLAFTAYTFMRPSNRHIQIAYGFLGGTVASGTLLVIIMQTGLIRACISGLTVSAVMYAGIVAAKRRLASENA